ncbi:MAG: methylenetetrahydrofolate reductase [Chloroflexi bacterium]|nr:methylenetetrahydrofolate reductase [Chloroflexota bacterium]
MSKLAEAFKAGKFVVTGEIAPPKGVDLKTVMEDVELLRNRVVAFNVTDQQSSVMRLGSLATSVLLKQHGVEPIFQITGRDRNRIAIQSDLLSAAVFGIEDVLCLTGDYVSLGDHPTAKPVFDLDSVSILRAASTLMEGKDMAGKPLQGTPKFFLGAVVTPGADPLEPQILKLEKKVKAGARFIQTQAVYDPALLESFMGMVKHIKVPVMLGLVLLKSGNQARFMNKNVAGVTVPDKLIEEMDKAESKVQKCIEISARLIKETRPMCQGVHIMAIGWEKRIPAILDAAGL